MIYYIAIKSKDENSDIEDECFGRNWAEAEETFNKRYQIDNSCEYMIDEFGNCQSDRGEEGFMLVEE